MRKPPLFAFRGFTLIELMVAVVVVGILAAVAYPAFTSQIQRSRRADATAALTGVIQAQERYRSNHGSYSADLGSTGLNIDVSRITPHYEVTVEGVGETASLVSGYIVTATAKTSSPQGRDSNCKKLVVKLQGALLDYTAASSTGADTSATCWPR